jgi:hypothetical protein
MAIVHRKKTLPSSLQDEYKTQKGEVYNLFCLPAVCRLKASALVPHTDHNSLPFDEVENPFL